MSVSDTGLSAEMEDYLEAISELAADHGRARVRDIAQRLSVRMPSVTQALRSLSEKGFVNYEPYMSPTLTRSGQTIADAVQRRHHVIRRFLIEILKIDNTVADTNACRLEHAIYREVLESLVAFMDRQ